MPPTAHAKLSASASHRWLNCTAAPGYEAQFPQGTSEYAEEGTLAHEFCEVAGRAAFGLIDNEDAAEREALLRQHERYDPEMLRTAKFYADRLQEIALEYKTPPAVFFEVRVELGEWIPEGFGTCDCCMIGGDTLHIIDYKHGKGVKVDAGGNSQMRLYALGALHRFRMIYGDAIKRVVTEIIQPRISEDQNTEEITTAELLAWGETVKPKAHAAYTGEGAEFHAGDWCRFCAGRAQCRARAAGYTALEEYAASGIRKRGDPRGAQLRRLEGRRGPQHAAVHRPRCSLPGFGARGLRRGDPLRAQAADTGPARKAGRKAGLCRRLRGLHHEAAGQPDAGRGQRQAAAL